MIETYPIPPTSSKPLWIMGGICLLLLGVLVLLAWVAWSSQHSRAEIHSDGLRLVGDLWGRKIPFADLDLGSAEILDIQKGDPFQPRGRTMGTGLPGYAAGWFRLRNGDKALVYLTRYDRVVHIPTRQGYRLMLSPENPERFLESLRARGG